MKTEIARQPFLAHIQSNKPSNKQYLCDHLQETGSHSGLLASKFGLEKLGRLIGLLHDFGKYSQTFQTYIKSAEGLIDQDSDDYIDPKKNKGKIDHSTAGAQYAWQHLRGENQQVAKVAALCIASHHSGLIDVLTVDGTNRFEDRMAKPDDQTHLQEAVRSADQHLLDEITKLINDPDIIKQYETLCEKIKSANPEFTIVQKCHSGLLVRMLFSCLIDADRINSINFEDHAAAKSRLNGQYRPWSVLIERLENKLATYAANDDISKLRRDVARHCLNAASRPQGGFTLTAPTGAAKTLGSLRFALRHAELKGMERIIFVVPYTTIIEQNADEVRKILETDVGEKPNSIVLEHHSNLLPPENQEDKKHRWHNQLLSENWDAPIVYTTSVQLLDCLFSGGTRSVRRMHQLAQSVIVFDEIQSLDIKMTHLFCNAMNFLAEQCRSSVVLCTATQPLLHRLRNTENGALKLTDNSEIIPNVAELFTRLTRTKIVPDLRPGGWELDDITSLAINHVSQYGNCLVVVNTKRQAEQLYKQCQQTHADSVHLSTSMCPAHRRAVLSELRTRLNKGDPVICISTQLIEAGVDISFLSAIRFLAGLDSIAQTTGRCNRNKELKMGIVTLVNPKVENLKNLPSIQIGKEKTEEILGFYSSDQLLLPEAMNRFYEIYFHQRANEMEYNLTSRQIGRDDSLLNILSQNKLALRDYIRQGQTDAHPDEPFQSFATAASHYKAIDAPTHGVVVPYGQGQSIINQLLVCTGIQEQRALLKAAQPYTVNVFPRVLEKLQKQDVLDIPEFGNVLCLRGEYYSDEMGLGVKPWRDMDLLYCSDEY